MLSWIWKTLEDVENIWRDIVEFDMSYYECKDLCEEACEDEDFTYRYMDRSEKEVRESIANESKPDFCF